MVKEGKGSDGIEGSETVGTYDEKTAAGSKPAFGTQAACESKTIFYLHSTMGTKIWLWSK